ncbi:serine/threonine-protein kinase 16 [Scaptodrosophila lebanonensis]|uniref:non-specific serine/threonine protein kinase n=1 Tax=Drosophila lebanonensis TaxID=7225 RepID=A0A6J2TGK7_DROLE|nr:serine/threonine-protein kinase 16 [Scaptodrosophila lebanonensis]
MHSIGWALIMKRGCFCSRETLHINGSKYTINERLAQGGFSLIDLAQNADTRRSYAIKRITCHSIDDQNIALREIENCRKIESEHVIKVFDYELKGQADIVINTTSTLYIVLPYYKHGSLADHLQMRARKLDHMPEAQILQIFLGICEGVKAIHEAKPVPLAHRDLKTANICLSNSFEPIIVDLGSMTEARLQICGQSDAQRLQDEAEERSSIVYRAPELFTVKTYCTIDERTDIWSLGCVLYAMCYFNCPFDPIYERGDSVALAVLSGNINIPEDSIYTQDMHDLIKYMLRIDPMERPFIYSVIEQTHDLIQKLEGRV